MAGSYNILMGSAGPEGFSIKANLKVPKVDLEFMYIINAQVALGQNIQLVDCQTKYNSMIAEQEFALLDTSFFYSYTTSGSIT